MLYTVSLDENNYILSVAHTANDNVELNLEEMELEYLGAYQLLEGIATLDENKKAEIQAEEHQAEVNEEIAELETQLAGTDEDLLSFVEDLFALKNPLTFISDMINLMKKYATLVASRQTIREQIEELKGD